MNQVTTFLLIAICFGFVGNIAVYQTKFADAQQTSKSEGNFEWENQWENENKPKQDPIVEEKEEDEEKPVQIIAANYQDALVKSKNTGKKVLVLFEANWCDWCKKMKNETFKDQKVKDSMMQYVLVFVDVDANKNIARHIH